MENEEKNMEGQRARRPRMVRVEKVERNYNSEQRQFRSRNNSNSYNNDNSHGGYEQNGYRPRRQYNYDNNGEPQQYQPRHQYNNGTDNGYRPRRQYNYDNNGEPQQYQPRHQYNNATDNGYHPRRQYNYDNNGGNNGYRPRHQYNNNNTYKQYNTYNASFKRRIEYKEVDNDPDAMIRLNKFLANAGICSRREADQYIQAGVISVNGQVVTELGTKVKRSDEIKFHDQPVNIEKKVYVLLNKPKDYVTTADDPQQRKTVMELVQNACKERIYPVGRLDRNTTGVLLLTNDGEMASKLTHPKYLKKKVYQARLDKNITKHDMEQLVTGLQLEDGEIHADQIEYVKPDAKDVVGIEIHSGRNRIVRRMFEAIGYKVIRLDRTMFAGLTKKNVRRGDWRYLTEKEVEMLRQGAYE